MITVIALLFSFTVCCWFSELRDQPFLGLGLFSVPPLIPFLLVLAVIIGWFVYKLIKKSHTQRLESLKHVVTARWREILVVALIVILHLAIELPATVIHRGSTDWDAAIWGLAGYHIADGTERPIYGYGYDVLEDGTQHYNGTIVPHITAVFHTLFGKSPVFQRLVTSLIYAGFLIVFYLLLRCFWQPPLAIAALFIAAIPPASVFTLMRNSEYPQLALLAALSLLLACRIASAKQANWRHYFCIGLVFGIGVYVIPHMVYLAVTVAFILFSGDRLFFLRARFWAAPPGFVLGATPLFIDAFYSEGLAIGMFFSGGSSGNFAENVLAGFGEFFRLITWYLGGTYATSPEAGSTIAPLWILYIVFAICLVLFMISIRKEIAKLFRKETAAPDATLFIVNVLSVIIIFILSDYSRPPAPYRYLYPLWLSIPPILAGAFWWLSRRKERLLAAFTTAVCIFFAWTVLFHDLINTVRVDSYYHKLEQFLEAENVERFYGNFAIVYNIAFSTEEKIIGSTAYHWHYDAYRPYADLVAESNVQSFFFMTSEQLAAMDLAAKLSDAGSTYRISESHLGSLITDVRPPVPIWKLKTEDH
jgi:hypothetical protein